MNIWNDTNPWPYNTFWWEGPDGSRVFGVVPPTHFIGTMEADSLEACWDKFTDKSEVGEMIYCYGWGDGGGVDTEMLEYVKRYSHFPGIPDTAVSTVEDALGRMSDQAGIIPIYKDELYLEAHRGVYTTKAMLKKRNRYCENLYRKAELFAVIAEQLCDRKYPGERLKKGWLKLLTNQFHDSLPGSHITSVYYDLQTIYDEVQEIGEAVVKESIGAILQEIGDVTEDGEALAVFNPIAFPSSSVAMYPGRACIARSDGLPIKSQYIETMDGTSGTVFIPAMVPAVGYDVYHIMKEKTSYRGEEQPLTETIDSPFYQITFDESGEITSIYDKKNNREVIRKGQKANKFRLYEDRPGNYEAWDIVATYVDQEIELEGGRLECIRKGSVCTEIFLSKKILDSELKQRIVLYDELDRIDFDTYINWVERRKLLKVEFDVDLYTKNYTSDIAYAVIERSACRYNKTDKAKFEASAHNFIDMSDEDYGVSLLNNCKYGHEVDGNRMMITLLKGPMNPDPESDLGEHCFTYSIYPHKEKWTRAETLLRGLQLNQPLETVPFTVTSDTGCGERSFVSVNADNILLEALKKSEDGTGYILRLSEKKGRSSRAEVCLFKHVKDVFECSMIERDEVCFASNTDKFSIQMTPFEVKTLKLVF